MRSLLPFQYFLTYKIVDIGRQETSLYQYLLFLIITNSYHSTKVVLLLLFSICRSETQKVSNRPKVMY